MVQRVFERTNVRKSPGPDNIGGRVLKQCVAQLSGVFCSLFQRSMDTQVLWKTAVSHPSSYKDYRPIGLTSLLGKSLEQIIKTHIINSCRHALDPRQFSYRFGRGADDAIEVLLNYLYANLEAWVLFADFSSAFNTIHPHILANTLGDFQLNSTYSLLLYCMLVWAFQNHLQQQIGEEC